MHFKRGNIHSILMDWRNVYESDVFLKNDDVDFESDFFHPYDERNGPCDVMNYLSNG